MAPRLLFVGFEAMDRDVARELVDAGRMPNLARLQRDGLTAAMTNPLGMLTGPVWASLITGVHPDRHRRLNWRVLRGGTYRMEYLGPFSTLAVPPMWRTLAAHGVSSLVLDVPTVGLEDDPLVTHLVDWHIHDRQRRPISSPPEVAADVVERYGDIRPDRCDAEGAAGELRRLRATILGEVETFADGVVWLMGRVPSDVVVACSGASHCAGHRFWHLHDPASAHRGDDDQVGDVMVEVYEALDAALGRILDAVPPDCTVAVVLSHGMGDNAVLPHLIDPIARAIDDAMGPPGRWHQAREFARRLPNRIARKWLRGRGRSVEWLAHIADGSRRFIPIENFPTHGALRVNVIGREPNGRVRREDLPRVLDHLEAELLAVQDADTGEPIARRVIRTADHYADVDTSGMADLLVEWTGTKVVETVTSPTIGTIHRRCTETRTGAHRQDGLVVLHGRGIEPGSTSMRSVDLWPTLASLLAVDPGDVDGHVIPEVATVRTG